MYCYTGEGFEGWGCKYVKSMFRHLNGNGFYKGNKYWYNYGQFKDAFTWVIDKEAIREIIMKEIKDKNISSCIHFNQERVQKMIESLPSEIDLDGPYFERLYRKDIIPDGTIQDVAINIRHVKTGEFLTTDNKGYVIVDYELPYDLRRRNRDLPLS